MPTPRIFFFNFLCFQFLCSIKFWLSCITIWYQGKILSCLKYRCGSQLELKTKNSVINLLYLTPTIFFLNCPATINKTKKITTIYLSRPNHHKLDHQSTPRPKPVPSPNPLHSAIHQKAKLPIFEDPKPTILIFSQSVFELVERV